MKALFRLPWLIALIILLLSSGINLISAAEESEVDGSSKAADSNAESSTNLHSVLEESEVLKMLRDQASQQDKKLEELNKKLNKELHSMEKHFEKMFSKISDTEKTLEENLNKVEERVLGRVQKLSEVNESSWGWRIPFVFLLLIVVSAGGLFVYMYRKATKHTHFL